MNKLEDFAEGYAKTKKVPGIAIALVVGGMNLVTPIGNCYYELCSSNFIRTSKFKIYEKV